MPGPWSFIEHALALRFRVVALLLKLSFLCTHERYERLHKPGHLRRVHVLAERLQDMHDANYTGEEGWAEPGPRVVRIGSGLLRPGDDQSGINPSAGRAHAVGTALPARDNGDGYHGKRGTSRHYVLARLARDGRTDLAAQVEAGGLSVRAALRQLRGGGQT